MALKHIQQHYVNEVQALACIPRENDANSITDFQYPNYRRNDGTRDTWACMAWLKHIDPKGLFAIKKHTAAVSCSIIEEMEELKVLEYDELFGESIDAIDYERDAIAMALGEIMALEPRRNVFGDLEIFY